MGIYASKDDVTNLSSQIASDYQLKGQYIKPSDLQGYQPKGDYAKAVDLQGYQPKGNYAMASDLQGYQPKDQLPKNTMWCNTNGNICPLPAGKVGQIGDLYFTSRYGGYPNVTGQPQNAEISNDAAQFKALMLVGNYSSGSHYKQVQIYDDLTVSNDIIAKNRNILNELDAIKKKIGL